MFVVSGSVNFSVSGNKTPFCLIEAVMDYVVKKKVRSLKTKTNLLNPMRFCRQACW